MNFVGGQKLEVCFCTSYLSSKELFGYVNLWDFKDNWPECSSGINIPKSVRLKQIQNIFLLMSWHMIQIEKFPTVQLNNVVSQKTNENFKEASHEVHFICICGNMRDDNLGKQTLLVFISVSWLVHVNQSNIIWLKVLLFFRIYII